MRPRSIIRSSSSTTCLIPREPFLPCTHTLHYIYPSHNAGVDRREPVACYMMRVSDSTGTVIGEAYTTEPARLEKKSANGSVGSGNNDKYKRWSDLTSYEKTLFITLLVVRLMAVLFVLFIYVCTLGTLSTAFSLLSSRGLGQKIRDSWIIRDPASALIVGMMATVLLQSATTFVNVLVSMVAANMITVHMAIPMMIGSELGTSFINGLISLSYAGERESFKRAFSAAILGDVFNVCCILIVLPIELITGFIEKISWLIVDPLIPEQGIQFKTLELLTDPISKLILEVDEAGLRNVTVSDQFYSPDHSFILKCSFPDGSRIYNCPYRHLFANTTLSDTTVATLIVVLSIIVLMICLFTIVYLINHIMRGRVKACAQKWIEKECPGRWRPCTGYAIMAVGFALTLVVQSNSVFSSSLTPLAGAGVISLKKLYALTLGSNIGATFSGVLAAMSADPVFIEKALHMAMCQVIYNIVGTFLFYLIPTMRNVPLHVATRIGETTATYRWFVLFYLSIMFIVFPGVVVTLSLLPPAATIICFVLLYILLIGFIVVIVLQRNRPNILPVFLRNWEFLPIWMRTLGPLDKTITGYLSRIPCIHKVLGTNNNEETPKKNVNLLLRLSTHTQV